MLFIILGTGAFFTVASGFFPILKAGFIIKSTFGKIFKNKSAFFATATALGATVGTGNIIGVASAIAVGGPGAVFWMWVGAFFGMMLKFAEAALAVRYKSGAMVYIKKAFGENFLSVGWCICCVLASFGGGNMIQTYAAGKAFENAFDLSPIIIGIIIAFLCGAVLFCGANAVIKTSSLLVPLMAAFYVMGCFGVLFVFKENLLSAIKSIFEEAFTPLSMGGGFGGFFLSKAVKTGISKGTFTHEAGMGSASLAHSESGEKNPLIQGCWGIVEVFIDTIFVCSLTALVILSAEKASAEEAFYSCFGDFGNVFLAVSMFLFALAAVIGWAFYGEKSLKYITKSRILTVLYRILFCFGAILGSVSKLEFVWNVTDIFNGLMIFPNLAAIIFLAPEVLSIIKKKEHR